MSHMFHKQQLYQSLFHINSSSKIKIISNHIYIYILIKIKQIYPKWATNNKDMKRLRFSLGDGAYIISNYIIEAIMLLL